MTYKILDDGTVRLDDGYGKQTLTLSELAEYMQQFRDNDPDYYAELVHIFVQMSKKTPLP